jgi:hypothetical protein
VVEVQKVVWEEVEEEGVVIDGVLEKPVRKEFIGRKESR